MEWKNQGIFTASGKKWLYATPTHILLTQTSHMALSNCKDIGMWNSQEQKENVIFVMSSAYKITLLKFF